MSYELNYNKEKKYLEITHYQSVNNNNDLALDFLFNDFGTSVTNIIGKKYNQVVSRLSQGRLNAINYNIPNLQATEEMTDMLFALGNYKNAANYPFFDNEKFENWCAHIPRNSKDFILNALLQDKKISLRYLISRSPCLSLYELSSHTLFQNIDNISAEKIGTLPIPIAIKNDLKEKFRL